MSLRSPLPVRRRQPSRRSTPTRFATTTLAAATLLGASLVVAQPAQAAPPSNDNFANAQVISGAAGSVNGTNVDATGETGETRSAGSGPLRSVWYSWTAPASGSTTFDLCTGTTFDTNLAVFVGDFSLANRVTYNDDTAGCGTGAQSRVAFNATAGVDYRIQVDGYNGASGAFTLTWAGTPPPPPAPPNDNFVDAQDISGTSGSVTGTNVGATGETGEPRVGGVGPTRSVWYDWTAPVSGEATSDLCTGTSFDTLLGAYTGTAVNALTAEDTDDDGCGAAPIRQSRVIFQAVAGTTYHIQVDGYSGATGPFTLTRSVAAAPATVSIGDVAALEGNEGTTSFEFPVSLSEPSQSPVTVDWTTVDGTAVAGSDYIAASGTVTFAPGDTSETITVQVNGDTEPEVDEDFTVVLSNPVGADLADDTGVGTILNDDAATAELSISMEANAEEVEVGQVIRYDIDVVNDGPSSATSVVVTDDIPAGTTLESYQSSQGSCSADGMTLTCELGTIESGSSAEVIVDLRTQTTGTVKNTASVSAAEPDSDPSDNEVSVDTEVVPDADGCTIVGTEAGETIVGTIGTDVICGRGGADQISAGGGNDTILGEGGDDVIDGGPGRDVVDGGDGNDDLFGDAGKDLLIGGEGVDVLDGGEGIDAVSYEFDPAGVLVSIADGIGTDGYGDLDTLLSVGDVRGSAFADSLIGSRQQDDLYGGLGDDSLSGSSRNDFLSGGGGTDILDGGRGKDICKSGETLARCES